MNRALVLVLIACGCAAEEDDEVGRHIDLEVGAGLEACGDLVGHMDLYMEALAERWQVELGDRRYTYRWVDPDTYRRESGCSEGSSGCARPEGVWSVVAPHHHELAHLVSFDVGRPPSFFIEGAAVAFEGPYLYGTSGFPGDLPIEEMMLVEKLPPQGYLLAGAYTRHLIDRFGMAAYLEFYGRGLTREYEWLAFSHEQVFGEPIADTIAAFDAERRDCEQPRFTFKLLECAAPAVAWQGETLNLRRGISCADDDVFGPGFPGFLDDTATTYASFEVPVAGLYELSAVADASATITVGSCGGCESRSAVRMRVQDGPQRLTLDAGPHYFRLDASIEVDTTLALQLRRVE